MALPELRHQCTAAHRELRRYRPRQQPRALYSPLRARWEDERQSRHRAWVPQNRRRTDRPAPGLRAQEWGSWKEKGCKKACLLYTSDAADDLLCVDLGGRRIIKKKKK